MGREAGATGAGVSLACGEGEGAIAISAPPRGDGPNAINAQPGGGAPQRHQRPALRPRLSACMAASARAMTLAAPALAARNATD